MKEQRRQRRLQLMKKAAEHKMKRLEAELAGAFQEECRSRARETARSAQSARKP